MKPAGHQRWYGGVLMGTIGMVSFSGTLPATHLAVPAIGPVVLTSGRIVVAAALGALVLAFTRAPLPPRKHVPALIVMGLGWAVIYPLCIALGLRTAPSVHGAVVMGLMPTMTALFSVARTHERPPPSFWFGCFGGFVTVLAYVFAAGAGNFTPADLFFVVAMLSTSIAYVEGAKVAGHLDPRTVLCWALIAMVPLAIVPFVAGSMTVDWPAVPPAAWAGFAYVCLISMFLGSFAWYKGLADGGIARISQLLVLQPIVTALLAGVVVHEPVTRRDLLFACVVVVMVAICIRSRVVRSSG